ncbi:MAG: dihydrofolate reductase family protein [Bacteroidota bacterium]
MSQMYLYLAASLDGFIARKDGSLDWLTELPNPDGLDYGYQTFYEGIDTVLMGRGTYQEILSFGVDWPYADCQSWILSRQQDLDLPTPHTHQLTHLTPESLGSLRQNSQKGIWVVGGGQVISQLLQLDAIDQLILSYAPILLGDGIPLVARPGKETPLRLIDTQQYPNGLMTLRYEKG